MAENWGFKPDKGNAFFISYNSLDWQKVAPVAKALHDMGYPVWYDSGLEAGTASWREQISASINRCYALIVFVTKGIFDRKKCYVLNEYDQATALGKPVIPVFLDEVNIPEVPVQYRWYASEWSKLHGAVRNTGSDEDIAESITVRIKRDPAINYKLGKILGYVRLAAVFAAAALLVGGAVIAVKAYLPAFSDSLDKKYPGSVEWMKQHLPEYTGWLPYPTPDDDELAGIDIVTGMKKYIYMGSYRQNGIVPEPIKWLVLAEKKDSKLVISQYLLDAKPYNRINADTTWADCSLRE